MVLKARFPISYHSLILMWILAFVQWQKENDPTRLFDTEALISEVIEKLLSISAANLLPHFEPEHLKRFKYLYGWLGLRCRLSDCRGALKLYRNSKERLNHEITHTRAYQCTDCGSNGFKSTSALRKHREKYHMKPEDFNLPDSLVDISCLSLNIIDV